MRQIEKEMNRAFFAGREWHKDNTRVYKMFGTWYVDLFGNTIARRDDDGAIYYSCAGWSSNTTRSRLVALGAPARIKNFQMIRTDTGEAFPCRLERFK